MGMLHAVCHRSLGRLIETLCLLGNFSRFVSISEFFSKRFRKTAFMNTLNVSKRLNLDQARHHVGPDLGPKCLQNLSADDTSRQRVLYQKLQNRKLNDNILKHSTA